MHVRLSDRLCLTPRLLDGDEGAVRRVEGVLETAAPASGARTRHVVDAVRYDGRDCRYLVRDDPNGAWRWLSDDGASTYRSFACLVVERLRGLPRRWPPCLHRFTDAPPSRALTRRARRLRSPCTLSALDSCITRDGRLWLRVALHDGVASSAEVERRVGDKDENADENADEDTDVSGWLPLTDAASADTASADAASVSVSPAPAVSAPMPVRTRAPAAAQRSRAQAAARGHRHPLDAAPVSRGGVS